MTLIPMAPHWETLDWSEFLAELELYRDRFMRGSVSDQELAYIKCMRAMEGRSSADRASRTRALLDFLNQWECRLSRMTAEPLLRDWIRANADQLDELRELRVADSGFQGQVSTLADLYTDLMGLRAAGLHNWSDACASKTLSQLAPATFVMWDNKIKPFAMSDYGQFLGAMHALARRLIEQSPADDAAAVEDYLQAHLGYKVHKTLAKYLDEYNWHIVVGRGYAERR